MKKQVISNIALFLTALIWGLSFVAQRTGMEFVGPFTFNTVRCFLGSISLLPVIFLIKFIYKDERTFGEKNRQNKSLVKGGLLCGLALFLAMTTQQYCMQFVGAGKAGFISSLYIIYVPLISCFFGKKLDKNVIISVFIAVIGLYLLCFKPEAATFDIYDGILLISAFFYAVHILVVNYFSQITNAAKLSCVQFFVVGLLSMILMSLFETPSLTAIVDCKVPLFYAGILTCGVAYTFQIFGQKHTPPVIASLILSLESVFAVAGGSLMLHEIMTLRETAGCILMISAVILSKFQRKNRISLCPDKSCDK